MRYARRMKSQKTFEKNSTCLLCGDKRFIKIFSYQEPDRYEHAIGVKARGYFRHWVRCLNCSFYYSVYSRPRNFINKIYQSVYRDCAASWRKETAEEIFRKIIALPKRKSETKQRVAWIKNAIGKAWDNSLAKQPKAPFAFLDIGGGAAIFAHEFKDQLWKPYITDPATNNSFVKTKLHIPLIQNFYQPGQFRKKFTFISLIYVLEHLENPITILKKIRKDLTEKSVLYIEVPDSIAFRLKPKDDDIFNACHLWMFDPETLTRLLKECGFEILALKRLKTMRGHFALMALAKIMR